MAELDSPVSPIYDIVLSVGKVEKVFSALIAKEKVFPFSCCKFTIFASEYQASFPLAVAQKWELFFVSKVSTFS